MPVTWIQAAPGITTSAAVTTTGFWVAPAVSTTATISPAAGWICILTGGDTDAEPPLPGWNCPSSYNYEWPAAYGISQEEAGAMLVAGRREAEERQLARQVADARATQLLLSVLTEAERESYIQQGFIEVQGSAGGWWRIRRDGQAGNVDELEGPGGERIASWCCHPPDNLPDADAQAAQLLQLVTNEDGFRRTGNRTPRFRLAA